MSQENVETIRDGVSGLNAWNVSGAGDIHELLSGLLHEDVEWHDQTELPGASVHHGVREVEQRRIGYGNGACAAYACVFCICIVR